MIRHEATLSIDFGKVGYHSQVDKDPFRVTLDAAPLIRLLDHAERAHRIYELLLVERPGDVWDYVWVVVGEVPPRVRERMSIARDEAKPKYGEHPWPEGEMPFVAFDRLFFWAWDDTDPECEVWLDHRVGGVMRGFALQLLAMAQAARNRLGWNDPLVTHVLERIGRREHEFDVLDREGAMAESRQHPPNAPMWSTGFYAKLRALVREDQFKSIAYRGHGDWEILRMLATEQRRRATESSASNLDEALRVSALVNAKASNDAWNSRIWFYDEGLGYGDLRIDDGGILGRTARELIEMRHKLPKALLTPADIGELPGFVREVGEGWAYYTATNSSPAGECAAGPA